MRTTASEPKPARETPEDTVEIIDLLRGTIHRDNDHEAFGRMMTQPGLVICENRPASAGGPPARGFRTPEPHCGKEPPAPIRIAPIGIHLRRNGEPDLRFAPDVPADGKAAYDYIGWLPLGLIRHPDGQGPHQAWATGDPWIGPSAPGETRTRTGVQTCALKPKACLAEALFRRHACWWTEPPPPAWPVTGVERRARMRRQAEQLYEAAHTLCYDLKVIERHAPTGKENELPAPAEGDAEALHRIAKILARPASSRRHRRPPPAAQTEAPNKARRHEATQPRQTGCRTIGEESCAPHAREKTAVGRASMRGPKSGPHAQGYAGGGEEPTHRGPAWTDSPRRGGGSHGVIRPPRGPGWRLPAGCR